MRSKTNVWIFQMTSEISNKKTETWLIIGNLKRETKSLLITAQSPEVW